MTTPESLTPNPSEPLLSDPRTPEPLRLPVNLKSIALQALFVVMLVVLGGVLWLRSRPERLGRAPDQNYKIYNGRLYMFAAQEMIMAIGVPSAIRDVSRDAQGVRLTPEQKRLTLESLPMQGGEMERISTDDTRYQLYASNEFTVADGKLYYALEPRNKSERVSPLGALGISGKVIGGIQQSAPTVYYDRFLPPKTPHGPLLPGEKRLQIPASTLPQAEIRYRQVPVEGGEPRDAAVLRPDTACLIGSHVFWIRAQPEESVTSTQRTGGRVVKTWTEIDAQSDLMLTSLADGSTRTVFHGIPRGTPMIKGETGIAWYQPSAYPDPPTLHYARIADGSVRSLGALSSEERGSVDALVEVGDRLYWTDLLKEDGQHRVLWSARMDGSDVREVCRQREGHPMEGLALYPYQGALYCCVTEAPVMVRDDMTRSQYLCRVRPDRSEALEVMRKLPKRSSRYQFNGDYLYYVLSEQERDLWDNLTDDPAPGRQVDTICRIPLNR